jgi:hypothetical protein
VPGAEYYVTAGFQVATAEELERSSETRHLSALSDRERAAITYHGADRPGDVIFNWFD